MSDLVKRARERLNDAHMATEYLIDDMADHIEAQAKEIAELENHIADAGKMVEAQAKEIAELRAALAAAREECAKEIEKWGADQVVKWADDDEMCADAKSRAWDAVCAANVIRSIS